MPTDKRMGLDTPASAKQEVAAWIMEEQRLRLFRSIENRKKVMPLPWYIVEVCTIANPMHDALRAQIHIPFILRLTQAVPDLTHNLMVSATPYLAPSWTAAAASRFARTSQPTNCCCSPPPCAVPMQSPSCPRRRGACRRIPRRPGPGREPSADALPAVADAAASDASVETTKWWL